VFCLAFKPPFFKESKFDGFCIFVDIIFAIDIVLIFRSSKLNISTGEEITNPKVLAKKYILSPWFWLDLLSILPFEVIRSTPDLLILFSLLKISRIRRIMKLI
jgi:hypothetical protein